MKKIRAIVIEDEKSGRDNLIGKLQRDCPNVEVIAACASGEEAIQAIHDLQPQLLFLDIRLGTMTGFDVLDRVRYIQFEIIFTTYYDQYALPAIKENALDYLLKPISDRDLIEAVNKAWDKIQQQGPGNKRIQVRVTNGIRFIYTRDILYCQADDNCTWIHLKDQKPLLISRTLGVMDQKLLHFQFSRISRRHTVNLDYIDEFSREDGGLVILKDGTELLISKSRREEFLAKMDQQ